MEYNNYEYGKGVSKEENLIRLARLINNNGICPFCNETKIYIIKDIIPTDDFKSKLVTIYHCRKCGIVAREETI